MTAPRNVVVLDAERRLRHQFKALSGSPQDFYAMLLDAKEKLERADGERLLMSGYAKRHPTNEPPKRA